MTSSSQADAGPGRQLNSFQFKTKSNVDNWGNPKLNLHQDASLPKASKNYYEMKIRKPCETQWKENEKPMSDMLPIATVIYSKNNEKYDNFESIDWVPENKKFYPKGSPWGAKYQYPESKKKSILASTCHLDEGDGRQWEITRIGPFTTTGGYDWIQIGWDDLWGFSKHLEIYPKGIFMLKQHMTPVFKNGTRIGFPPIHIHHIHTGPSPYVRQRGNPLSCTLFGKHCWSPARTAELHGDYVCTDEDGGHDCHIEDYAEGYGKLITKPLGIEGELNDVRATNSEPLEWYWEMGIQWVPNVATQQPLPKALSLQNYAGPGTYNPSVQRSYLITFQVPTNSESMFWYTGQMNRDGELLRMKLHAHNTVFDESFFFAGSPEDLGLYEEHGFSRIPPANAILPGEVGFESNAKLKEYFFSTLAANQQKEKERGLTDDLLPRLVCHSIGDIEVISGFAYDRRAPTSCDEWKWKKGQIFTVIGFNKWRGYPLGPHEPSLDAIPPYLAGHVGYWMSYDSLESPSTSHWGYSLHNRYPDGGIDDVLQMEGYQKIAGGINGYTSPHFHDWSKTPNSLIASVLFQAITHFFLTSLLMILCFGYGSYLFYSIWKKMSRESTRYKKDDELVFCDNSNNIFFGTFNSIKSFLSPTSKPHGNLVEMVTVDEEQHSLLKEVNEE